MLCSYVCKYVYNLIVAVKNTIFDIFLMQNDNFFLYLFNGLDIYLFNKCMDNKFVELCFTIIIDKKPSNTNFFSEKIYLFLNGLIVIRHDRTQSCLQC